MRLLENVKGMFSTDPATVEAQRTPKPPREPVDDDQRVRSANVWGIVALLALLCVGGGAAVASSIGDQPDEPDTPTWVHAQNVCRQYVSERLKAPATAEFSDEATIDSTEGIFTVTGAVDAQNSFGAFIRSDYTCMVERANTGGWQLVLIAGLD